MNSAALSVILAALLAASAGAQNYASQKPGYADERGSAHSKAAPHETAKKAKTHRAKATRGEAASLETKEADLNTDMREDNRGRLTSAHPHSTLHAVSRTPQHHAATLKTGQLTTSKRSLVHTKKTALHRPVQSGQNQDQKLTPDTPSTNTPAVHLKKHNARMF
jgi:hypothetical protein